MGVDTGEAEAREAADVENVETDAGVLELADVPEVEDTAKLEVDVAAVAFDE